MAYNQMAAYGNNKVLTATPAELTLMLYEGAIKFCNMAKVGMERRDYEKANMNVQKARNIIVELQSTLNFDYEVAKDFDTIYNYIFERMVTANVEKDAEILEDVLVQLRDVRDIWKQIMRTTRDDAAV